MQSRGLDFLQPIWKMIYSNEDCNDTLGLNLDESDVSVSYTRYTNSYKNTTKDAQANDKTIDDVVRHGLTPGTKLSKVGKTENLFSWKRNSKRRPARNGSR